MKRVKNMLFAILLMIVSACNSEQATFSNRIPLTCHIQSRGESTSQTLPIGSQILVNATGGIVLENEVFTFNGSFWVNEADFLWDSEEETSIIALYPLYSDNDYTSANLYSTEELEDVLIARKICSGKETINLQFEHLFSSLTISIEEALQEDLQDIQLTIPVKIGSVSPQEGTYSLIEETHIITRSNHEASEYSFIIPPSESCILTLTLIMKDNTVHEHALNPHTFQSGVQYECNVLKTDQRPGIRNAEQLIAFSQLINGGSSSEWELSDFGEEIDEQMVYRLLADIELTEDDCNNLEQIGETFSDIFDGEGHTISNLKISAYNGHSGLFETVGETGIIQNLNIENGSGPIRKGSYSSGIGFIAGICKGIISNCHVNKSVLSNEESSYIGGIAGYTSGKIINCSVKNTTLESAIGSAGSITGYLYNGFIINSYSSKNENTESLTHNGGICGYAQNGTITNCYIYYNTKVKGQILGTGNNSTVTYSYCDQTPLINDYSNCTTKGNYKYKTDFTVTSDSIPLYQLLNQWINTQTTYTDTFIQWQADTTLPAVFITQ